MVSTNTLCKKLLNVKTAVIEGADFHADGDGVNHILIHARPDVWHKDDCPFCHKRCRRYDRKNPQPRIWRGLDWGGTLVEISYDTHRIECPEHGVLVADVPWAYPGSWLDMAEIEIGVMSRQALGKPLPDLESFKKQIHAWTIRRNRERVKVNRQFKTQDARIKLAKLYPVILWKLTGYSTGGEEYFNQDSDAEIHQLYQYGSAESNRLSVFMDNH